MPTSRLILIEVALVALAALIVYWIITDPFASGEGEDAGAVEQAAPSATSLVRADPTVTPVPATPTPTPEPTPDLERCGPPVDAAYMENTQIVSYYGHPYTVQMGILGELEPEALVAAVKQKAADYDALNGPRGVRAALHIVYGTAQPHPGNDGLHLLYLDDDTLNEYLDLACENELLVFIDLQVGHSTVEAEVEKVLELLEHPHVHLAIDPEFTMPPGEIPGESIGTVDAAQINAAQQIIEGYVEENGLGDRILVVHRFTDDMITRFDLVEDYERVHLVIDMDGFGPIHVKQVKYGWYAEPAEYRGIKLFYQHDTPLMTESEVLELDPHVIIYQ